MAIKINFDVSNIPENPTLILATRKGDKIGKINAQNIVIKDSMTDGAEITFSVNKYINNVIDNLWNNIKNNSKMIKVGIIGCGFVGGALKDWLEHNNPECKLFISDPP